MDIKSMCRPRCYILSGPPCSGKTTFRELYLPYERCICKDDIRTHMAGGKYVFDRRLEEKVQQEVDILVAQAVANKENVVIDQTNVKLGYLQAFVDSFKDTHNITIYPFYEPLWKLYLRNIKRYLVKRKWIPFKVINTMCKNQKKMQTGGLIQYFKMP